MKIDVRYKLLLFLLVNIASFLAKDIVYGSIVFTVVLVFTFCIGQYKVSVKYTMVYLSVIILCQIAAYLPRFIGSMILMFSICIRMFMPILLYAKVFIQTTKVSELITALYLLKIPRSLVIAFTVAIRFIPTAKEEFCNVKNAMYLRGISLSIKNICIHPTMVLDGFMVPLIVRASTIADELSVSSITRGIDNPSPRTSFYHLHINLKDTLVTMVFVVAICSFIVKTQFI